MLRSRQLQKLNPEPEEIDGEEPAKPTKANKATAKASAKVGAKAKAKTKAKAKAKGRAGKPKEEEVEVCSSDDGEPVEAQETGEEDAAEEAADPGSPAAAPVQKRKARAAKSKPGCKVNAKKQKQDAAALEGEGVEASNQLTKEELQNKGEVQDKEAKKKKRKVPNKEEVEGEAEKAAAKCPNKRVSPSTDQKKGRQADKPSLPETSKSNNTDPKAKDKAEHEAPRKRKRAAPGEATSFARRECPQSETAASRWRAIRDVFDQCIKPRVACYSKLQDRAS